VRKTAVALLVAFSVACHSKKPAPEKQSDDDRPRASAGSSASTDDASSHGQRLEKDSLIDEGLRFKLLRPNKQYRLVGEKDARALGGLARAGAMGPGGIIMTVAVDPTTPKTDLDKVVDALLQSTQYQVPQIEERSNITFASHEARRFGVSGTYMGQLRRACGITFTNQGYVYSVEAWMPQLPGIPRGCAIFEPMFATFSLIDGKPTNRPILVGSDDEIGTGYRLRNQVYETTTGYRIRGTKDRAILVGDTLRQLWGNADVGLLLSDPEAILTLRSDIVNDARPDVVLAGDVSRMGQLLAAVPTGDKSTVQLLGRTVTLQTLSSSAYDYVVGVDYDGTTLTEIVGWAETGLKDRTASAFASALGDVEPLSDSDRKALTDELDATPSDDDSAEGAVSYRGGTLRHFTLGLTWTKPAPSWRVDFGAIAAQSDPNAIVIGRESKTGISSILEATQALGSDESYHDATVRSLLGTADKKAKQIMLGGKHALVTEASKTIGTREVQYRITTLIPGTYALSVISFASKETMLAHPDAAVAFETGLGFSGPPAFEDVDSRHVDNQLGFSIALDAPWKLSPQASGFGRSLIGRDKDRFVEIVASQSVASSDPDFFVGFAIAEEARLHGIEAGDGDPEVRDELLGGRRARRFTFSPSPIDKVEAVSMRRDHVRYTIISRGSGALDEAISAFKLLER
jgi:hypothetical protein